MKLHLSIGEVTIKSLSVHQIRQLREKPEADETFFSDMIASLYGLSPEEIDALPAREWYILTEVTSKYSLGKPLADIKNSFAGDDGLLTPIAPATAATAAKRGRS